LGDFRACRPGKIGFAFHRAGSYLADDIPLYSCNKKPLPKFETRNLVDKFYIPNSFNCQFMDFCSFFP
jgi:hypothetical protein